MSLRDLVALYLVAGVACAVAIYRRADQRGARGAASAALAIVLWPIWAPVALTGEPSKHDEPATDLEPAMRVQRALREGVEACAGTSLESLLSKEAAARIGAEVARAAARHAELEALLQKEGFDSAAAAARVRELEGQGASARAVTTARLHLENVRRLRALRDRDASALAELADLVQALRTQLVLARFAGSSVEGVGGIVSEVWARVEGLGVAIDDENDDEKDEQSALA